MLADIGRPIVGMNAYLGADAILSGAWQANADVIIGGRLADPSMYLAPLMHRFGWGARRSGAAGRRHAGRPSHGMRHADDRRLFRRSRRSRTCRTWRDAAIRSPRLSADGSAVITKLPGTGGCVTPATVKEQLLYEVHDPAAYLTPDVTADFSRVTIDDQGKDRVRVSGAPGRARPDQLKVTVGFDAGFLAEAGVSYAGPAASRARAARLRDRRRKIEDHARDRLRHAHRSDRRQFALCHRGPFADTKAKTCACTLRCARRSARRPN